MEEGLNNDIPQNGGPAENQSEGARIERLGPSLLERVTEALIFASDEPIIAAQIARIYSDVTGEEAPRRQEIEDAVVSLNASYDLLERSFRINNWAGGYRMATIPDVTAYVQVLHSDVRQRKLTRSLMETVAILAYRQPVPKSEVDFVRGVDCDYAIRKLLEYGIIDVVGRSESVGKPLLYGTTDRFLELFGLNSVSDLPNLRELEAILDDPAFQREKAKLLMTSGLHMTMSEDVPEVDSIQANPPESNAQSEQEI
ncbi:MAG: SMC-Scp complex subunit ScpB [Bacteroidetes bacterium]|nr:SMC-Scp complex subunit ScpB [Bacteroidota bacterium]